MWYLLGKKLNDSEGTDQETGLTLSTHITVLGANVVTNFIAFPLTRMYFYLFTYLDAPFAHIIKLKFREIECFTLPH